MNPAMPRAVIFDLDGTLADTAPDLAASLNQALMEHDLPPHPLQAVRLMIGGGLAKLAERALAAHGADLGDAARERFAIRLYEIYAARPAETSQLYPGAAEALIALQGEGVRLGLCTNKPHAISVSILESLGIAQHFACVQGSVDGLAKDVACARDAGLARVVVVSYGYSAEPAHELGADFVIGSLADLAPLFAGSPPMAGVTRT
jgi:phosphoglycolate phosphatase